MKYPIIFACKYRKHLLTFYGDEIKSIFVDIARQSDFSILEMEVDKDHIHLLVKSSPKTSTLQIVRRLKQMFTHRMWQSHPSELRKQFWKEKTFWSDGYLLCSIGNLSREIVEKYIQTQG